jgi:hypothetical protein
MELMKVEGAFVQRRPWECFEKADRCCKTAATENACGEPGLRGEAWEPGEAASVDVGAERPAEANRAGVRARRERGNRERQ